MKKQTNSNFIRMANLLPELDAERQRRILGGTAVATSPPDDIDMVAVPTVTPCLAMESVPVATSIAPVPTLTTSVETSAMPVATTAMPTETTAVPEMMTSLMPISTTTPVSSTDSPVASIAEDFVSELWNAAVDYAESTIDKVVHVFSEGAASLAEGFAYAYLDFKYNGWDAGNGICNIPFEEYIRVREGYHAYHFSFDKGLWRDENRLPENPSYSDVREIVDVITLPGFVNINSGYGKIMDYVMSYGANQGIHYGIERLLDLGEPQE